MKNLYVEVHPEVALALAHGQAVVALESTIISHGMPWPQNADTALRVEAEVRAHGAVPATVAVVGGRLKLGLTQAEIEGIARQGLAVPKLSRRDLPFVLGLDGLGATTVAATMMAAHLGGVRIFATGGIGGVHRGAERSFDVSADLLELSRTPVAVVCAGAKAILDLRLTLEVLETHGVPIAGFGTDELPAFYSRHSGLKLPWRLNSPQAVAQALRIQDTVAPDQGFVIANPIAAEHEIPSAQMQAHIEQALAEALQQAVAGPAVTPFLLARVTQLSGGASLKANIELVLANAGLAAQVAVAYASLASSFNPAAS